MNRIGPWLDENPSGFLVELHLAAELAGRTDEAPRRSALAAYLGTLSDAAAADAILALRAPAVWFEAEVDRLLGGLAGAGPVPCGELMDLARACLVLDAREAVAGFAMAVAAEDEGRRYEIEDVLIPTPDGIEISALVVRPRVATALPALLEFTIYVYGYNFAREAASRGYASVVAYSRGKGSSGAEVAPFEHDGADAATVIDWIAAQPWSDGRVGMYGGSYSGFTQWAAAKHRPAALAAIAASASAAPGIDIPMQAGIFQSFFSSWPLYVTDPGILDESAADDRTQEEIDDEWFRSGRSYRELDAVARRSNPIWQRWLDHPVYDEYWQRMIPTGSEFAGIDVPVLATTGYGDGGQVGVLHYFREHHAHRPGADHTLLVGPFDHIAMQRGVQPELGGYRVDPAAMIDLRDLRYRWFDHVLRGGPRPELLEGSVNFQVMGADRWDSASSIAEMSAAREIWYLEPGDGNGRLLESRPESATIARLTVDLADRSALPRVTDDERMWFDALDLRDALLFEGTVLDEPIEISGVIEGRLEIGIDRRDVDLSIELYEELDEGGLLRLTFHRFRASLAADRRTRRLLEPHRREVVDLRAERIVSRRTAPGSRIVAVVRVLRRPDLQIDYGTGRDVSDESIEDSGPPLTLVLGSASYLEIPVSR